MTSMTSILSNQSDITILWDSYNQSSDNLQFDQQEWNLQIDDIIEENNELIIDKDNLDMVAHTFYLRKKELERLSYPDLVEDGTLFYNCEPEPKEIQYIKAYHLEVLDSGAEVPVLGKSWCLPINIPFPIQERKNKAIQ